MIDVVLELVAEMLDEAGNRHGRGITECANGATRDLGRDIVQEVNGVRQYTVRDTQFPVAINLFIAIGEAL